MDLGATVYFMTDRLARGPASDERGPSMGSPKYPSRDVQVIYLFFTFGGVVWDPTRPLLQLLMALG